MKHKLTAPTDLELVLQWTKRIEKDYASTSWTNRAGSNLYCALDFIKCKIIDLIRNKRALQVEHNLQEENMQNNTLILTYLPLFILLNGRRVEARICSRNVGYNKIY